MSDTRNLFHLQCAAKLARAATTQQKQWLRINQLNGADLQSSEITIRMERKFFLSRNQSQKIIDKFLLTGTE